MYFQEDFDRAMSSGDLGYPEDCGRIRRVGLSMGITMTDIQAQEVWWNWSDMHDAQWLYIKDDDEVETAIQSFIRERTGE
jgi:hypothetical protein